MFFSDSTFYLILFFSLFGVFLPVCHAITPVSCSLSSPLHAQPTTVYLCSISVSPLSFPFCPANVARPYEMRWYKWHFMGLCSTTRPNMAGNHKSHCLLRMPLLMCSIWFNASDRWGRIGGEASKVRLRGSWELGMEIKEMHMGLETESRGGENKRKAGQNAILVVTGVLTSGLK